MKIEDVGTLIQKYVSLLADLESGSSLFCEKLVSGAVVEYQVFDSWRQNVLAAIQNVDTGLHRCLSEPGAGLTAEEFRQFEAFKILQKHTVKSILQTDAVIISLTKKVLNEVREDLSNLTHGRRALQHYGSAASSSALVFDQDA
jgi:hypothetical protein